MAEALTKAEPEAELDAGGEWEEEEEEEWSFGGGFDDVDFEPTPTSDVQLEEISQAELDVCSDGDLASFLRTADALLEHQALFLDGLRFRKARTAVMNLNKGECSARPSAHPQPLARTCNDYDSVMAYA
eukprot:SAG11_NODE_788_length_7169_cov_1.889109_1_plen_129_part_00